MQYKVIVAQKLTLYYEMCEPIPSVRTIRSSQPTSLCKYHFNSQFSQKYFSNLLIIGKIHHFCINSSHHASQRCVPR